MYETSVKQVAGLVGRPAQGRSSPMDDIALGLRPELLIRSDDIRPRFNDTRTSVVDDSKPRL